MTDREKVGQRLVVGFPGTSLDALTCELIEKYKISNFILFRHNIENREQLKALCRELQSRTMQATGHCAFITIDQEGGMVTRLSGDCANAPGAMAVAATGDPGNAYLCGKITAAQLREVGINFDLAPVADINSNPQNPVIGVRSYGDRPEKAIGYITEMMRGLSEGGVLSAAKHFPGHGDTCVDSHLGLPSVDKGLEELMECELKPFAAAIQAGIPAIMTTHILFPQLDDSGVPATMSRKIITGLLKKKMKFDGLVISDSMEMNAIGKFYGTVNGVLAAAKAGVDLIFIAHTGELARQASDRLVQALEQKELDRGEMDESVEKILSLKDRCSRQPPQEPFDRLQGKRICYEILCRSLTPWQMPRPLPVPDENTCYLSCYQFRTTKVSDEEDDSINFADYLQQRLGGRALRFSHDPSREEIGQLLAQAAGAGKIIIGTYNGSMYPGQLELVRSFAEAFPETAVFALRSPYDLSSLPENVCAVAAYEYSRYSFDAIIELLQGKLKACGKLPISEQVKQ